MELVFSESINEIEKKKIQNIYNQNKYYIRTYISNKKIVVFDEKGHGYVIFKKKSNKQITVDEYNLNCNIYSV